MATIANYLDQQAARNLTTSPEEALLLVDGIRMHVARMTELLTRTETAGS